MDQKSAWTSTNKKMTISTFGTEHEMFIRIFTKRQEIEITSICSKECENNKKKTYKSDIYFYYSNKKTVSLFSTELCRICKQKITRTIKFTHLRPTFLLIGVNIPSITHSILPQTINIEHYSDRLLCETYYNKAEEHFVSLFSIFDSLYYILMTQMLNALKN